MKRKKHYFNKENSYLRNRIDVMCIFYHYKGNRIYFGINRLYSIIKTKIVKKANAVLFNIVNYYRKMTNEWSGKNCYNIWKVKK